MTTAGDRTLVCWSLGDKCVLAGSCITGDGVAWSGEISFACTVGAGCPVGGSPLVCGTTEDGWFGAMLVLTKGGRGIVADKVADDIGAKRSGVAMS